MSHIFVSYSHKDRDYVEKLEAKLIEEGFNVWIDHRIDYGTQWPREIQDALDACQAFIVVVTENAFESEWVQNEVARAKRKRKPLLPLLLQGDAWLSIETTQYVDIRDGSLPPENFYEKLEEYAERVEIIDSTHMLYITNEWKVFQNKKYKFQLKYPLDVTEILDRLVETRFEFPTIPGTNLREKFVKIECSESDNCTNPLTKDLPGDPGPMFERRRVKIGELLFLKEIGNDVGMSHGRQWVSYSIARKKMCVTLSIHSFVVDNSPYFPYILPKIDLDADQELILYIASTFCWIDK